ncbi:conserved hypothetical protein [Candidatus Zixiibacteriota bacterium]|nr:conserved hypothetical protein [candidate division Zixibacteria bacterium]
MRIAVTGATGFIGQNLIRALALTGNEIIGLARHTSKIQSHPTNVRYMAADINDAESLPRTLQKVNVIYHLVGIIAETKELTFTGTVVTGTENIIAACKSAGVGKIIYLSALGTGSDAMGKYFRSKWEAEEKIRNSGLEYAIIRPSVVYGPGDRFINMLARMIKYFPVTPIPGSGRMRLQPIYVENLTALLVSILDSPGAWGKTLEIGGPEALEYRQMIAIIKKVLNRRRPNIYIPLRLMKLSAAVLESFMKPSPLTRDQIGMLSRDNICDNRELLNVIDIKLTRMENDLKEYLR